MNISIRAAGPADRADIRRIYNQGIAERCTLDTREKSVADIASWFSSHDERYAVLVAECDSGIAGWASLNRYSSREAHVGIADLSIYVDHAARRLGIGTVLMAAIEEHASCAAFDKIVLMTFPDNRGGRSLFGRFGFRLIGIYMNQGRLDGRLVDTIAMEKLLSSR